MGEIVSAIAGIGEACRALDFPVISGNCSLYNETNGEAILPTPAIGGVGLLKDVHRMATVAFKREGDAVVLIGETKGHLGQSIYLREIEDREDGSAPPVDLSQEKRNGDFVRALIVSGRVDTAHDLSDGGLLVAVAEMAMAGNIGASIDGSRDLSPLAWLFGEDQGRYLLAVSAPESASILAEAQAKDIAATLIGMTGGTTLKVDGAGEIALGRLKRAHERWFPAYMTGEEIPPTN